MKIINYLVLIFIIRPFSSKFNSFYYYVKYIKKEKITKEKFREEVSKIPALKKFFKL